ncbi:hypothetical protein BDFG_05961 [Blastomyces dermatitidis ATCC 26199]|nr:hypothetical protein BDFG_05961 [Blastomyces dermatitidis ATCC 26199]
MDELQRGHNLVDRFQWKSENGLRLVSAILTLFSLSAQQYFHVLPCNAMQTSSPLNGVLESLESSQWALTHYYQGGSLCNLSLRSKRYRLMMSCKMQHYLSM